MDINQNRCKHNSSFNTDCRQSKSSRSCSTERTCCPPSLTRTPCSINSCGKPDYCPSKKVFTCPKPQTTCVDPCKKFKCYDNPCVSKKECPNVGSTCGNALKIGKVINNSYSGNVGINILYFRQMCV